ncbi:hypothetical protein Tco_1220252 [Tanacetum coccineum]
MLCNRRYATMCDHVSFTIYLYKTKCDALRKCILKGPYTPMIVTTPAVPAIEDSPAVPEQTTVETAINMTPENRAHFEQEKKEAIHLILTGIGDEIYLTVDACQTAQRNVGSIERLHQGEITQYYSRCQDKLIFVKFGQFTLITMEKQLSLTNTRFYKMMNEKIRNNFDSSTMQFQFNFYNNSYPNGQEFTIVKQQHN